MKKVDLLAQIEATSKGIAKVEQTMVSQGVPEVITMANGKVVRKYTVNVAVTQGDTITFQNMPIVTFNEGLADEEAVLSQGITATKAKDFETKGKNYLDGLVTANTIFGYKVQENSEDFKYVIATVIENVGGVATAKTIFVYKPTGNPITHIPFAA